MIVFRLYGQFHLSGMVCYYPAAVIPADVIDSFAEGVKGKHREGLRVNRPFKDCVLVVSQNGKEIARKKMKKALPAEMIHIDLKAEKLENKGDLEVKVE